MENESLALLKIHQHVENKIITKYLPSLAA